MTFGDARNSVTLSDDLSRYVVETVRRVGGAVTKGLEQVAEELEASARAGWPVGLRTWRTHSRDQFVRELRVSKDGTVSAIVKNTAPYAFMIKSSKIGNPGSTASESHEGKRNTKRLHAWSELVRKPAVKLADKLAQSLGPEIVAAVGRR